MSVWHVLHKPTAKTLCGQPNDGTKPPEGTACNDCATVMYDIFGGLLDELETALARLAKVGVVVEQWETDCKRHLDDFGQHLMGGAVAACAEEIRAVLGGEDA